MFFLAFLPSVEIVSKIWHRALIFSSPPFFFFLAFFLAFFFSFFLSPPLCNFSIQTYLWFGHQEIYILVFNDQLYVTVMSNTRVGEEPPYAAFVGERREGIAESDFGRMSAQLYDPCWVITFSYSYWWSCVGVGIHCWAKANMGVSHQRWNVA